MTHWPEHRVAVVCAMTCALALAPGCGRIGFTATADSTADVPGPPGLVALYAFDDDPTDGVSDTSGNGHTGSCVGACPIIVGGYTGAAYRFDAVDDLVVVPYAADFGPAAGVTVSAWVQVSGMANRGCAASKKLGPGDVDTWALCIEPNLSVLFYSGPDLSLANDDFLVTAAGVISTGIWQHVAISWDGTTKRIWVGGQAITSRDAPIGYDANDILLGGNIDSGRIVAVFDGAIDDIRIFDRALEATELAQLAR